MISKGRDFSEAQRTVNMSMDEGFCIGNIGELDSGESDIKQSLSEFSKICEEFRHGFDEMLSAIDNVKKNIHKFDEKEYKTDYKDHKKTFTRASEKYYSSMHSGLQIGEGKTAQKKKNATDNTKQLRADFHHKSLDYVDILQTVEERKKYQLVEQFLLYSQAWSIWLQDSASHLVEHEPFNDQIKRQLTDLRDKVNLNLTPI